MNENRIKEIEDLKKVYNNIDSDKMVIAYCGSGVTAPINIVAMDEVGLYSRLYLGSYSDYVSYKDNVIEKD
jgi:thiosulfate/3-mercaptopyruvate sulfurtransferase